MGDRKGPYRDFVGNYHGKRPLGKSLRKWKDNIKFNFQNVGTEAGTGLA
jgi:hypothetical protein